ncbi:MAG TPA: GNAT family N-acetyltransferase [Solirubrobacteraceae bacterium]|nr:GNAT family N-acetyltransferase [Solirubrobacteraceae bacterium]
MPERADGATRRATAADAPAIGRLLYDFNTEFGEPTPSVEANGARIGELIAGGDTDVVLAAANGDPVGLAVLRFRPALWSTSLECYLAELYVAPEYRGDGLGRALMEAAIELARGRGADYMDLGTAETDTAARALYESLGFSNREGRPDGPVNYYYEREL